MRGFLGAEAIRGEQQLSDSGEYPPQYLDRHIPDLPGGVRQPHHHRLLFGAGARGRAYGGLPAP